MGILTNISNRTLLESVDAEVRELEIKYQPILEHVAQLNSYLLNEASAPEIDKEKLDKKIDEFIDDAHDFIDNCKKDRDKHYKRSVAYMFVNLGLYFLLIASLPYSIFVAVLMLIGQIIALILQFSEAKKGADEQKKVEEFKSQLVKTKAKVDDKKKKKLDTVIERINSEMATVK